MECASLLAPLGLKDNRARQGGSKLPQSKRHTDLQKRPGFNRCHYIMPDLISKTQRLKDFSKIYPDIYGRLVAGSRAVWLSKAFLLTLHTVGN